MSISELSHIEVSDIMQGNNKVILLHANKHYLLSITRRGKLILTVAENKNTNHISATLSEDIGLVVL